ncbi:TIGR02680 family protein [Kribbella sp. NPDC050470]|uniref:TIGR02680 family protein n=1 Tax=unclassified Kribbella TaxID=2644121 RepID=UPI00378B3421
MTSNEGTPTLSDDRFRPSRAGVINLWDYRDEEFVFADGRLVLRGPNGSGKTKALEVLFPFVLDGRIEPRRLNPFASEERTMKSNLLFGGQDSAYGYVWMEFTRRAVTGDAEAVTIGTGLRAQRHNDRVTRWYFVTPGRVGVDFSLLGPDDRPLTKKQLVEQLGARAVVDRSGEHRAAVDAALFGLGPERYEQLLALLLTLRRPQLARNLDPKSLSRTLADGLRPLDDELIKEAARSFDHMESVQRTLDGLVKADEAARTFLGTYTTYLRTHARAAADIVGGRLAEVSATRDALAGRIAEAAGARTALQEAEQRREAAAIVLAQSRSRLESLQASDAYKSKADLDKLVELVESLGTAAAKQRGTATRATELVNRRSGAVDEARTALDKADRAVARAAMTLATAAGEAGIEWDVADATDDEGLRSRVTARTEIRRADVLAVEDALTRLDNARQEQRRRDEEYDRAQTEVADAELQLEHDAQEVAAARDAVTAELARWAARHESAIHGLDTADLRATLGHGVERIGEPDAPGLGQLFDRAVRTQVQERRDHAAELRAEHAAVAGDLQVAQDKRAEIATERDDAPPAFHARTAPRDARPGTPLWRLIRFADHVAADQAAAVEAALEAANLLDAWVFPDDQTLGADESDAYLVPLPPARRPAGRTLATVLTPEPGTPVDEERIVALLESIVLADLGDEPPSAPTVSPEQGSFALGIQIGAHHKPYAEYIGATARERRRAARLAELDQEIAGLETKLRQLGDELSATTALLDGIARAERDLPATGAIIAALRKLAGTTATLQALRTAEGRARAGLDQAIAEAADRERRLHATAAMHSIAADATAVQLVRDAIDRFVRSGDSLVTERRDQASRHEQLSKAEGAWDEAREEAQRLDEEARDAELTHAEQTEALTALQAAVGADVEQLLAEVEATRSAIHDAELTDKQTERELRDVIGNESASKQAADDAGAALARAVGEAQADAHRLAPYAHRELLDILRVPADHGWPATTEEWETPERLAAQTRAMLAADPAATVAPVPDAVARLQAAILRSTQELRPTEASLKSSKTRVAGALSELQAELSAAGHDYRPEWSSDDDVIVVRVADEQGFAPVGDFARRIEESRRDQELLLTEAERRILEDALLGRLSQQIHDRTLDARDLISKMVTEMRSRRMSSGASIGMRWELADWLDDEQRAVCRLLEHDAAGLGPDDLATLRSHYAREIKRTRANHPDRSYSDLLAEVLDYRRWRTFVLQLLRPDGSEERLTQAKHSLLSGGEQSVSLHMPLFAAAHVTLSSATVDCPRLIALDEAFAGVDEPGRRELLGVATQFDLDLFMTGYDLWATHDTVPGCAHYDLRHSQTDRTVSAVLMVWDGKEVLADTAGADLASRLGSPGTRRRSDDDHMGQLSDIDEDE